MSADVMIMIDAMVLEDLLLTRHIDRSARAGKTKIPSHEEQLKEYTRTHYENLAELRKIGGEEAIDLLVTCLREKKTTGDLLAA